METELEKLEKKIADLKRKQANCAHEWGEAFYDPDKEEIVLDKYKWVGVDPIFYTEHTGEYRMVPSWSRICKKCGMKERTRELETVIIESEKRPKFGK